MIPAHYIICESEEERQSKIREANRRAEWKRKRSRNRARTKLINRFVMNRANSRCEICAFDFWSILNIHHILPVAMGGSARVFNLIALCPNCHGMVHHYRKAYSDDQAEAWSRGIQSAGYTEQQAKKILLIASREAIVNHDGSISPYRHPESECYVLKSELKIVGETNDVSNTKAP